jgi:trans-2-enoyl-CoA reductase
MHSNPAGVMGANGTLVTYGAMSRKGISIPFDVITHKQLKLKGFWMNAWHEQHRNSPERKQMIDEICGMIRDRQLSYHFELHDFDDFNHALKKSQESFRLRKVVLNMDYPDR